ncbi:MULTISPECIES: ParB/RepB/Spo0J family partition protein [Burkholderiaceae]|uniref:ParB/RepB/Spo0J family partition protein n=1 Tax=Burkholderiaceae TaxID=119060 RepID=UPI000961ACE6|nr:MULTISPECIES: ParB/RepB/Spo0J family partition protein [Burkholderiaceae]MCG1039395.1 ParB/RepB/Spo0J family partition protein [Mycetohabitans sp. B7]SIT64897.1 chromosome partitioning protein, ParB family [Burkholderia sp. b14]
MSPLKERMSKGLSITLTAEDEAVAASMKPPGPTTGPGQTMQIAALRKQLAEAKAALAAKDSAVTQAAEARIKELEEQLVSASAMEIPLERLHEVPGRRRYMDPAKFSELRENLRHNKLVTPVTVRLRADGDFEIVSGHHRTDAFRELGRPTIRCVLEDSTELEADDGAFFANLMQSDLTDYEKYAGLKRFHEKHPNLTQTEVAERTGISQSHLSALLSFDRLPAAARSILDANQSIMGATAAAELAALTDAGKGERVIEAVKRLAERKLDQAQAVKFVKADSAPKSSAAPSSAFKVKAGKSTWCDVRRARNVMRIEFQSEEMAQAAQDAIRQHLETLAKTLSAETEN